MYKRRFQELDYEERFEKKARFDSFTISEESIEDKLDELIVKIGEKSTSSIDKNIEDLADIFNFDILPKNTRIVDVFCECVVEFPHKICIYSTLVGLLNVRNYSFGGEVVEKLIVNLRNHLKNGQYERARFMVRFLADLVNTRVISCGSLINLFENLVDVTMEDNIPQVRSDYFVFMVLSALPWVSKELYEKKEQELDQILNTIDSYMTKRTKTQFHSALKVWHSDNPHPQEEYLGCLWNQISKLREEKWVENHIYRPYIHFDNVLCEALQHNVSPIKPPTHEPSNIYQYPQVVFRLFDYTDCPERSILPGSHSIDRFVIEDNLRWIFNLNCFDRKDCATAMLNYLNLSIGSKIPLEYVIVEVMFGEMFALPKSKFPEICYGSILLDLCKLQPSTFPQVLAQAVELLFDRLDSMNGACINRFASWFAYHLSNFQFRWNWDDWSIALKYEPLHPKPKFIAETLQYCLRLSYHTKVFESAPQTFHKLAPELAKPKNKFLKPKEDKRMDIDNDKTMNDDTNDNKNNDNNNNDDDDQQEEPKYTNSNVNNMIDALRAKCSVDEIIDILNEITDDDDDDDDDDENNGERSFPMNSSTLLKMKIEIFVTTLLNVSSKSMTHTFSFIAKYRQVLKKLAQTEEAQIWILNTIFDVWSTHQQLMVILIDKLMKLEVLQYPTVAIWVFSKANSDEFMNFYMWEMLHSTIKRTIRNIKKCTNELEESRTKLNTSNEDGNGQMGDEPSLKEEQTITYEMIEKLEEKLDSAQSEQKNLFLIILQRFIMILTEHIQSCEAHGKSFRNYWYFWTMSRLQEVLFLYNQFIFKYQDTYESLLFTNDVDSNILAIFKQFLYLHA
ncbi:nuclear cap-binding protein subunit 1 [Dermatophagoides farinae]|uniref:nuclear cap-binding protein subunit 1 n=1 Tax=Dermatophagoides farinae TaxID=6954 RepID=UPI003F60B4D6